MTWHDPTSAPQSPLGDAEAIRRANEDLSHSASIWHVGPTAPSIAAGGAAKNLPDWKRWFDTANKLDKIWSPTHSLWITLTPIGNRDDDDGTRAVNSYGNLTGSGVGPAVTVDTGTGCFIDVGVELSNDASLLAATWCAVAVSGATGRAAQDSEAVDEFVVDNGHVISMGKRIYIPAGTLTAGSNVFTMQYKTNGGTATFSKRHICVTAFPT